jgi:hypothetical protein
MRPPDSPRASHVTPLASLIERGNIVSVMFFPDAIRSAPNCSWRTGMFHKERLRYAEITRIAEAA